MVRRVGQRFASYIDLLYGQFVKCSVGSILSAAVADGGQWTGCISSHVHTDRLLVWDTLEDFFAILTSWRWTRLRQNIDEYLQTGLDEPKDNHTQWRNTAWWTSILCNWDELQQQGRVLQGLGATREITLRRRWAAPDVHQRGVEVNPRWKKELWGSL
jgi:hypothetical protein